jgi:tRNA (cmo5U34)-methyltransferase
MTLQLPPSGAWTFKDQNVAENFDQHVREQLPWYDLATGIVVHVARHVITRGGLVYDIGASTGNIERAIGDILDARGANLVSIDESASMEAAYRLSWQNPKSLRTYIVTDATEHEFQAADLIVCFLVLMFVPKWKRPAFLDRLKAAVRPGGALVVFDKTEPAAGYGAIINTRLTLAAKYEAGAAPDEIIGKELALAGVQRPLSATETDGMQEIFRFGDFAGWVWLA